MSDVLFQSPEEKGEAEEGSDASKSEISLVYEIALKRNLSVNFEVRKMWQNKDIVPRKHPLKITDV